MTTRHVEDGESARRSVPALGAGESVERLIADRTVGVVVGPDGNYNYAWIDGETLVDVVVIQMALDAVTKELAETVLGNVRILTRAERSAFADDQLPIPSGPETALAN